MKIIRGSMSPSEKLLIDSSSSMKGTSLQGLVDPLADSGALFIRVLTEGNRDLKPETSTNTNLGVVVWTQR